MYTLSENLTRYKPVIQFAQIISRPILSRLRALFFIIAVLSGLAGSGLAVTLPGHYAGIALGVSLIATGFWLEQILLYSYHNSFYFYGLSSLLGFSQKPLHGCTYEVAEALIAHEDDVTKAFCLSRLGTVILLRAGIDQTTLGAFLKDTREKITASIIPLPEDEVFTLISLGQYLLQQDLGFKKMLQQAAVTEEIFIGALTWVVMSHHQEKKRERWWGRDNLSTHAGIGREWSYGTPHLLEKFSRDVKTSAVYSTLTSGNNAFAEEKIAEIEIALARAKAANVLLIGEAGVGKIDLLLEVNRRLQNGKALGAVEGQRMILLDTSRLFAMHSDKSLLEQTILNIFTEAVRAGNIIIVIENISSFIREAESAGVYIPELLDPFLGTSALHVIATDTPGAYHTYLEPLGAFSRRFAEVLIDAPSLASTIHVLQDIAMQNENRYQVLFTYGGVQAIATAADRYLVEGAMPDKAIELLVDIATRAQKTGTVLITADYVYTVVSEKTGIPVGPITQSERELLLALETKLHERVIGQPRAIDAIARTMRRARAGIQNADKPIGSFLFLGPTGVGKTETAKALAWAFFGDEAHMHRIDMSEFSGADALPRLLGDGVQAGTLPSMLREHPYAVLLLDEFEKGSQAVHDIFLQILDEGMFTDARGEKVNARNTIVIATSNAGSQLIQKTVAQRQALATLHQEIINAIVKDGTYRPELLNRFDSTIIFEPLTIAEQGQIATLMLAGLYERVRERGYELVVNQDLLDVLVEKGYDPQFGARPMQRVLQDVVEEKVAQYIISGSVAPGGTINLSRTDFSSAELAV